jgi:hypothetical protein
MYHSPHLSFDFKNSLRHFVFYYFNGTLNWVTGEDGILKDIDYRSLLVTEASLVEMAFAIYANNIEFNEEGTVINQTHAMKRAAQYIRSVCDPSYIVAPKFEDWEVEI